MTDTTRPLAAFSAFVAVVIAANWLTATLGLVTWLGLVATAGTWVAGFAFVARDYLHEAGGKRWVAAAIVVGALISALFSPALALASGVAFLFSELADWAVYTPLRERGRTRAAIASNVVGAFVDTLLFLWLAGFPLSGTATQVLVKVGTTTLFVLGVRLLYLANPCGPRVVEAMRSGVIGYIDTPAQGNTRPDGVTWCADNGCFSDNWDESKWWRFLTRNADRADSCLFAVAPDVVGDAAATLEKSAPWLPRIRGLGYPVAFVAQDGLQDLTVPWDDFDVLFIGGTTAWKLGPHARTLAHDAKRRGKWVHMGRVNSERRFRYARAIGCDSADGTQLTFDPTDGLRHVLAWARSNDQLVMEGLTR